MKKKSLVIIHLLVIALFSFSCEKDDGPRSPDGTLPPPPEANLTVTASSLTPAVDDIIEITIDSNTPLFFLSFELDNNFHDAEVINSPNLDGALSTTAYVRFDKPQDNVTLNFTSTHESGQENGTASISLDVVRGQTVKVNSLTLTNFEGIDETNDPEYDANDDRRFADVGFRIFRDNTSNFPPQQNFIDTWLDGEIMQDQQNLTWDFSDEGIYFNPQADDLRIHFFDDEGLEQDESGQPSLFTVLTGPDQNAFSIAEFIESQPEEVTITFEDEVLTFTMTLDWPE